MKPGGVLRVCVFNSLTILNPTEGGIVYIIDVIFIITYRFNLNNKKF